ncbi:MAG: hypothetical protein WBV46_10775 [Terriglobales bacterium]
MRISAIAGQEPAIRLGKLPVISKPALANNASHSGRVRSRPPGSSIMDMSSPLPMKAAESLIEAKVRS